MEKCIYSTPCIQIFEIVNLANELLPPLPEGTISLPISSNLLVKGSAVRKSPVSSSSKQEDTNGSNLEISAREKLLYDQPELLQQFGVDLLPVLIQVQMSCISNIIEFFILQFFVKFQCNKISTFCLVFLSIFLLYCFIDNIGLFLMQIYGSSVNGPVRHKCLSVIGKLMYFSTAEMIQSLLNVTNISRYQELEF